MRILYAMTFVWLTAVTALAEGATVTVQGSGIAEAVPDIVILNIGVEARAEQPQDAADAMAVDAAEVLAALIAHGVAKRDVQTQSINLQPVYETRDADRRSVIVGFVASNRYSVILRDLDLVGPVLGAVLEVGADRLEGLRFDISDPLPLLTQARQRAVEDAHLRAETYAKAAGLELGAVLHIQEGGGGSYPRPEMMMSSRMASDMAVAAGTLEKRAQVTVTYALKQP
jgi:uncharacterized protein YggE